MHWKKTAAEKGERKKKEKKERDQYQNDAIPPHNERSNLNSGLKEHRGSHLFAVKSSF